MLNKLAQSFHDRFRHNEAKLHELSYLFWECTQRCNLRCLHCGSDCSADPVSQDMPFDDFLSALLPLKTCYPADSITVVFTGGEPLLRHDLAQCGKILREHGFRWGLVTNGLAYTSDLHARLLSAGMGSITLSLDGLEPTHNWLRNHPGSFKKAVQALDLISASKRLNYDVVTCVHHGNLSELPALKDFLISRKVKAWRLFTIAPIGRAAGRSELGLTNQELRELLGFIRQSRPDQSIDIKLSCEAYVGSYERKVRDSFFFCRAGINIASILNDGSVSACPNIHRHYIQGSIYHDRFIDLWNNRFEVMRDRSWTRKGLCADCRVYRHCNGGAMHLWDDRENTILNCIYCRINEVDL